MKAVLSAISNGVNAILGWVDKTYRNLVPTKWRFLTLVVIAFLGAWFGVSIDSAWADKLNVNWLLWFLLICIILLVISIVKIALDDERKYNRS
jgi:uncharacterized membrane protein YfcA